MTSFSLHRIFKLNSLPALFILLSIILIGGCATSSQYEYKPASGGQADEILWVMNDAFWADTIGYSINTSFQLTYEVLPQDEPDYFLRKKNYKQFNNDIIKKYRTIVLVAVKDEDPQYSLMEELANEEGIDLKGVNILKSVWATPQSVILITAENREELSSILNKEIAEIKKYIREEEDKRVRTILFENEPNHDAIAVIQKRFGFTMDVPSNYFVAKKDKDVVWLRKETAKLSSNIIVYKKKLKVEDIEKGVNWDRYAIVIRNYLGALHIASRVEGSYMSIEEEHAPIIQSEVEVLNNKALKTIGLWKLEKDFMGGPFTNYGWFDEETLTYYMVDGFVHAPGETKKKYMRHLEMIFTTLH